MGRKIDTDYLVGMRERALRVLANHSSGSARRMAEDTLFVVDHLLSRDRVYKRRVERLATIKRVDSAISELESQFGA